MKQGVLVSFSAFLTFALGFLLLYADAPEWVSDFSPLGGPDEPILVILVGNERAVQRVRSVLPQDRILASSPGAFALAEERIVAANSDAASESIIQLGWVEREIEIVAVPMDGGRQWERARNEWVGGGAAGQDLDPEKAEKIAALMQKPTLNAMEATFLLQHMDATGQF